MEQPILVLVVFANAAQVMRAAIQVKPAVLERVNAELPTAVLVKSREPFATPQIMFANVHPRWPNALVAKSALVEHVSVSYVFSIR